MSPDQWKKLEEIFARATELPAAERSAFLDTVCNGDGGLRKQAENLLKSEEDAGDFIESPVWTDSSILNTSVKRDLSDSLRDHSSEDTGALLGSMIGPFRLEKEIGKGGMGAVYLAERADGEFRQKVAIKVIKRGMDSDFIVRRFRHERQILASFEHPFIARLLDGGTSDTGVPYFVMEYIDGLSLYDFCDKNRLSVTERLKLFQRICSALEYAHGRQIVHRDIKPTNILIKRDGTPKLLDFGIAKILDPNLIHESMNPTASMLRMMTPDYASPEQVRGEDVTPASDIYSLGVLLYELVSGHRPFIFSGRALHEITYAICEVQPLPPSAQIGSESNLHPRYSGKTGKLYESRSSTQPRLRAALEGDLDNVIMKAMAKSPGDRYAGIKELVAEIGKLLSGEPVSARRYQPAASTVPLPVPEHDSRKSLAVLPFKFVNLGSEETTDDGFLGLGLTDALISRLSKIRRFLVRPTSSILAVGDRASDPIAAGRELGVDFILDGTIKRAADRLRVTVQLLDVRKDSAVWATSIDETYGELLALEDSISNKLVEGLLPELTGSELARFARRGTDVPEAFEHYMRGRYHFNTFTEDGLAKAFVSFHSAIAADPNYAVAYSGLADYYNWLGIIGVLPPQECFQPAIAAASSAVELDDELSEGHASLGFSMHAGNYQSAEAEEHLQRAIQLNPANANAHVWYSIVLFTQGRFAEGIRLAERGVALDPLTPFNHHNLGWGYYFARRYDDAELQYLKVIRDFPDYGFGYYGLSKIHRIIGETSAAIEENRKASELMGDSIFAQLADAECLAAAARINEALERLGELETLSKQRYVSPYQLSLVYCYLAKNAGRDREDQIEKALTALENAFEIKEAWLNWLRIEPVFDELRDEPRFIELLTEIGPPVSGTISPEDLGFTTGKMHRPGLDRTTMLIDGVSDTAEHPITPRQLTRGQWTSILAAAAAVLLVVLGVGLITWRNARTITDPAQRVAAFRQPSLVVLPFKVGETFDQNIGTGVAEQLSQRLGSIKGIQVLSPNTGRILASSSDMPPARDLGVQFLLRGRLERAGTQIRLAAEFIEAETGEMIWNENFDAPSGDLFGVQSMIARKVLETLGLQPMPDELRQLEKKYTENFLVYEKYLIGRSQMASRDARGLRRAISTFSTALEEDPAFAPAYVSLADSYSLLNLYDIDPPPDAYQRAHFFATQALKLDEGLAEAHASMAYIRFYGERDRSNAELEFRRAVQMNPSYAQAHHWFALVLSAMGKHDDALAEIGMAERLDPRSLAINSAAAMVYFFDKKYSEAIHQSDRALAVDPEFIPALKVKRWVYAATGDLQAARALLERERTLLGGHPTDPGWQIIEAQLAGTEPEARSAAQRMLETAIASEDIRDNDVAYAFENALAFAHLGKDDQAIQWLSRAERARNHGVNFIEVDPRLERLRSQPAFRSVVERMKAPVTLAAHSDRSGRIN